MSFPGSVISAYCISFSRIEAILPLTCPSASSTSSRVLYVCLSNEMAVYKSVSQPMSFVLYFLTIIISFNPSFRKCSHFFRDSQVFPRHFSLPLRAGAGRVPVPDAAVAEHVPGEQVRERHVDAVAELPVRPGVLPVAHERVGEALEPRALPRGEVPSPRPDDRRLGYGHQRGEVSPPPHAQPRRPDLKYR